ncbi:hypothetical protein [Zavarzinia sp.]|uniref:hypothetical protein n=1 Tax=Zavarzinia sp. TaxID=2027920 RepID=UPI003BB77389
MLFVFLVADKPLIFNGQKFGCFSNNVLISIENIQLPKLSVVGSIPIARSIPFPMDRSILSSVRGLAIRFAGLPAQPRFGHGGCRSLAILTPSSDQYRLPGSIAGPF